MKVAGKLFGVVFFGGLGLFLLTAGADQVGRAITESALSISGLAYMIMGGVGVIKATMIATCG